MKRIARLTDREKAFLSIFLASLTGGAVTTFIKVGLTSFPPLTFAFLRFLLASLILLPFFLKEIKKIRKGFVELLLVSLFSAGNIILFVIGVKFTTATIGQLLYAGVPLITGILSYYFFNQYLKLHKIFGILIGFFGVAIIVLLPIIEKGQTFTGSLVGNLLVASGVILWSFYMTFSKRLQETFSPFIIICASTFITAIATFPLFILEFQTQFGWWNSLSAISIISIFYVSVVGTIFTHFLNQYAIKHGGSVFASMQFYLLPIIAFIFASIILGEKLFLGIIVGGVLVLLGVFLTTKK